MGPPRITTAVYAMGAMIGVALGTAFFRAVESGGEWWVFPPALAVFLVAWIKLFNRNNPEDA